MSHKNKQRRQRQSQQRVKNAKRLAKSISADSQQVAEFRDPRDAIAHDQLHVALQYVANALNTVENLGIPVQLAHNAVITSAGYVFAINDNETKKVKWQVRTRQLTEFQPVDVVNDDGDD